MSASDQSTECEILYDSVLNSKNDESEENTTRNGDEDDFLSELMKLGTYEINMQRRLLLRPDIGKECSALYSSQLLFTDFLFGDDLQKHLKDIGTVSICSPLCNNISD